MRYHDVNPDEPPHPLLGNISLLDYAEDLEREVRKFENPPILMGHSMGGLMAQILASRGLATALVLLTPASPHGIMALKPSVIKSFWSVMKKWGFWKDAIGFLWWTSVISGGHTKVILPSNTPQSFNWHIYCRKIYVAIMTR